MIIPTLQKNKITENNLSHTSIYYNTAVIKTCAYTNRYALNCAFGEEYNELYLSSGSFFNFHSLSLARYQF